MGANIRIADRMRLLPRPQCGALAGIASVGLPQSTDQITNPLLVGADAHARVLDYSGGERLFFDLTAPDYPSYIYVDYFDAGGAVLHLTPNDLAPLALVPAQSALSVGARAARRPRPADHRRPALRAGNCGRLRRLAPAVQRQPAAQRTGAPLPGVSAQPRR